MSNRWYGSITNRLEEGHTYTKEIKVGTGVTEMCYSDRHPYEVVEVIDDRHLMIRRMNAKRIDNNGMSECQDYEYSSNLDATPIKIFLSKTGWREQRGKKLGSTKFSVGFAEEYYDFSF